MKPIKPQAGQESVWDYPRPPRLEDIRAHVRIVFNDVIIADTNRAKRITLLRWMRVTWATNGCERRKVISMVDGLLTTLLVPLKEEPEPGGGNFVKLLYGGYPRTLARTLSRV